MRRKLLVSCVGCLAIVFFMASFAIAKNPKGPSGPAGKSNVARLYLYEKSPVDWTIVEDGAWGKMKYRMSGPYFEFVFNGKKLVRGENYTLIYYPDPWPGSGLICLGTDTARGRGNVHIEGQVFIGEGLPLPEDLNNPENPGHEACSTCIDGAKIWLVLSDDVDCEGQLMIGWNPSEYLFEDMGIFYTYVDE